MSELVSILIPAYNAEKWIVETLNSALNQTWSNKEIIVVDDGSTDNTFKIVQAFESKTVKVTTQQNKGSVAARNRALSLSQGDYIQWLDADDLLAPDKIATQLLRVDTKRDNKILLTASWGKFYYRHLKAKFKPDSLWQDLTPVEWLITKFVDGVWMNPAAWLVSRQLAESAGPWDERLSNSRDDDGEYISRVVAASQNVIFVPESKCYYRVGNAGSLSWKDSDKVLQALFLSTSLAITHLRSLDDSERAKAACLKYLQRRFVYFYPDNKEIIEKINNLSNDLGGRMEPPKESLKYAIVSGLLGRKAAKTLKNLSWKAEVSSRKYWDRALQLLSL